MNNESLFDIYLVLPNFITKLINSFYKIEIAQRYKNSVNNTMTK